MADPSRLISSDPITIESRVEAEQLAHDGDGTTESPYVIRNLSIDGATTTANFAFRWNDPEADYSIRLENIRLRGSAVSQIYVATATSLVVSHAEITGAGETGTGARIARGQVSFERTEFSGLEDDGIQTVGSDGPIELTVADCRFSDAHGPWGSGTKGIQGQSTADLVRIRVVSSEFDSPSLGFGLRTWRNAAYEVTNTLFRCELGIRGGTETVEHLVVTRCVFETTRSAIWGEHFVDWEVGYSEFRDNAAGVRLVRFDDCGAGRAHHNKFTKTTGEGPGNECLESFDSRDVVFDYNWVTTCTEDAFEHVRPRGHCVVSRSVGDDVALQIVDFFGNDPENGGEISHIYGNCGDVGVLVTDVDNISVHDIHTDNSAGRWSNVTLEQRHTEPGTHPAGCTVRSPLPTPEQSAEGGPFGVQGIVGPGNTAEWWEDGALQEFSS
ncbi:MAG: hypothetical protein KC591_13970 [Gemmatimonadetes bacterium]|nr:hypothetical protein [Gemmatimonadota bacterium]